MKNNKIFKRIGSLLLAVVLLLVLCPVTPAQAAETMSTEICPCCGKNFSDITWTKVSGMFASWTDLSKAGHYKIGKAFTENKEFTISGKVTIDFGGYKLQAKSSSRGFVVKNGGMLTLLNTGGTNGRLEGHKTSAEGGAIKVEAGGTLNIIGGRVIGTSMSYNGGAIYNEGTVNMAGGKIDTGKANDKSGGNIYNAGTLNFYGGTVTGGSAKNGGNIYNAGTLNIYGDAESSIIEKGAATGKGGNIYNAGVLNVHGGVIQSGSVSGDDCYGGNIFSGSNSVVNMYDGQILDGVADDSGGNFFITEAKFNMYGGTVSGGTTKGITGTDETVTATNGGNFYVTKATSEVKIYGGTVTGGNAGEGSGGNFAMFTGAQFYMYGGTVEKGVASKGDNICVSGYATLEDETKQYSSAYFLGGAITDVDNNIQDLYAASGRNKLAMYGCHYTGGVDVTELMADCCCYLEENGGYTVWNAGYEEGTCTDCIYAEAVAAGIVTVVEGTHSYIMEEESVYVCIGCGKTCVVENVIVTVDGNPYESLEKAISDARTNSVIKLMEDISVSQLALQKGTLDLNGFTLIADAVTSVAGGNIIDSAGTGLISSDSVTVAENNTYLPVTHEGGIRFSPVDFTQWVEPVDVNTTKVKFYFTQRASQTILDEAINSGNTEVDVHIYLTWKDASGNLKEKTVSFGSELVKKYAEKWNKRVFVATIGGTAGITDLQVAYRVTSTAASGTMLSADMIKSFSYINDNLTWDKINSYPIKTTDMTVEEMRQLCVDFMVFNKTYLWTPDQDVYYIRNSAGTKDSMLQGTVYGGLPYVGVATGNPYRMMDYINPETGLLDMQKALPLLGTKERLEYADLKYFGSQCSIAVYWAWGRVMNSTNYKWTSSVTPYNNFIILGDVVIPETVKSWNDTYGTDECIAENDEQALFRGYAQLQKADGMVYYTTAGHLIMAATDAVVVYDSEGNIDGENSYIYIHDQAQKWVEGTNEYGDTYQYKDSVMAKKTFNQLIKSNYIPFTFAEFTGEDDIEITEVALVKGSTTYVKGTVSEADRSFVASKNTASLTWSNLMASKITTNYGVVDAYIIVKDSRGNEIYKHAVRTATAGNTALELEESGEMVTTWENGTLTVGKAYDAEIVIQLSTGERPTIWSGKLTMDK